MVFLLLQTSYKELYELILKTNHIDTEWDYIYVRHFQALHNPELAAVRQRISKLEKRAEWLAAEGKHGTQEYEDTDRELEAAQTEVLKILRGCKVGNMFSRTSLEDIQRKLGEKDAILEYVRYSHIKAEEGKEMDYADCYCGFAITKTSITLYFLCGCEVVDTVVNELIAAMGTEQCVDGLLEVVAKRLLASFQNCPEEVSNIYIVPDSVLYRLPFELLIDCIWPDKEPVPLSVVYLSSGRELLRNTGMPEKNKILILADPQYALDGENVGGVGKTSGILHQGKEKMVPKPDVLPPLRFSEAEARRIAGVFGENNATVLTGKNASAVALLAGSDADILHIATHGFSYQSEKCHSSSVLCILPERMRYFENCGNPLLRCGLYLAGASDWLCGGELPGAYGNGILLGHDLAAMDLSQYRLAVLSACQTAGGDVHAGEGIKGLRHAFELAGIGCLICALWEVDDLASVLLMTRFYRELLVKGTLPSETLEKAKQYVRTITAGELLHSEWNEYLNKDVIDSLLEGG